MKPLTPRSLYAGLFLASFILLAQGQHYLTATGGQSFSSVDCYSSSCVPSNPCSPSARSLTIAGTSAACEIYIDSGNWNGTTIAVDSSTAVSLYPWHFNPSKEDFRIDNISLIIGSTSAAPTVSINNLNITRSFISVASPATLTMSGCTINMTESPMYGFSFSAIPNSLLMIDSCHIFKTLSPNRGSFLLTSPPNFVMVNTTVDILDSYVTQGTMPIENATITDSYIRASGLFQHVENQIAIVNTVVSNMTEGLTYNPLAATNRLPSSVILANSSFSGMSTLFNGTTGKLFTMENCSISDVQQRMEINSLAVVSNTNLTDSRFDLMLLESSNGAIIARNRCKWTGVGRQYPCFTLTSSGPNIFSPAQMMDNIFEGSGINCAISTSWLNVTQNSTLVVDRLCVEGVVYFLGYLRITQAILTSVPSDALLQSYHDPVQLSSDSIWEFNSIVTGIRLSMNNHLKYQVTNASAGITTTLPLGPPVLMRGPTTISVLLWTDPTVIPRLSSTYPIFSNADTNIGLPATGAQNASLFGYHVARICPPATCTLNFIVSSVICRSDCNSAHSSGCRNPNSCYCNFPWYGPTCDLDGSCHSESPGPQFVCIEGNWISTAPVEQETISVPPNAGTVVVNGGLNISQTVIFSGLGAEIFVNGCVIINGDIVVQLSADEIKQIKGGGSSKTLITSASNETCTNATNLSLVGVTTGTSGACEKVSAQNTGSRQALSVVFSVDSSGCSKSSHVVAIVVPTVVGVVVVAGIIGALIIWKVRATK